GEGNMAGPAARLSLSLGLFDDSAAERRLALLAMGGWEDRRDLAYAIGGGAPPVMRGALSVLASDERTEVRRAAGWAASRRPASGRGGDIEREVVSLLGPSDGASVAIGVLNGLSGATVSLD